MPDAASDPLAAVFFGVAAVIVLAVVIFWFDRLRRPDDEGAGEPVGPPQETDEDWAFPPQWPDPRDGR